MLVEFTADEVDALGDDYAARCAYWEQFARQAGAKACYIGTGEELVVYWPTHTPEPMPGPCPSALGDVVPYKMMDGTEVEVGNPIRCHLLTGHAGRHQSEPDELGRQTTWGDSELWPSARPEDEANES